MPHPLFLQMLGEVVPLYPEPEKNFVSFISYFRFAEDWAINFR